MYISVEQLIKEEVERNGRGWCFTSLHFQKFGSDASIRKALSNLQKNGFIRRLTQGVYDFPKTHDKLGVLPPDLNKVAQVIAEKNGVEIQPSGDYATNVLGLSTQVPAQIVFLTNGTSRVVKVGKQKIIFKKASQKTMAAAGTKEGLLIQALKHIGKEHIDEVTLHSIAKILNKSTPEEIKKYFRFAPSWIRTLIFKLVKSQASSESSNRKNRRLTTLFKKAHKQQQPFKGSTYDRTRSTLQRRQTAIL